MNIVGLNREKGIFKKILEKERFAHTYIFTGVEGIGKKLFAINFAKSALCKEMKYFDPCECSECALASNLAHPDIFIINDTMSNERSGKNSIGIEEIKAIIEDAYLTPYRGKFKFFIVNDAHILTNEASNAFLKTLEEPPENTVFILITHLLEKILPTIKSRSVIFEFLRLSNEEVVTILKKIYQEEEIEKLANVAKYASGSVKTAIEFLKFEKLNLNIDVNENLSSVIDYIFRSKEKDDLELIGSRLYENLLLSYRKTYDLKYITFSNYLLNVLNMLNKNLNINVAKTDIIIKLYGVFGEKS